MKGRTVERNGLENGHHHDSSAANGDAGATAKIVMKGGKVLELDEDPGSQEGGLMDEARQDLESSDKSAAQAEAREAGQLNTVSLCSLRSLNPKP